MEFFKIIGTVVFGCLLLILVWSILGGFGLVTSPWVQNQQTKITRATNSYITTEQEALRDMKSSYDAIEVKLTLIKDPDTVEAFRAQEKGIIRQMKQEADLIPNDVQPDIRQFLSTH
jgi:Tfp pilus assembly protein PilN